MKNNNRHIEILTIAAELFIQQGFAQTKMIEIAQKANISKGLLYFYYQNKEDLFLAVLEKGLDINLDFIQSSLNTLSPQNGLNKALTLLDQFLELGMNTAYFQEIIIQTMQLTGSNDSSNITKRMGISDHFYTHERLPTIREKQFKIFKLVSDCIEFGQQDGSILNKADPAIIYLSIWSFIIGFETMLPVINNHKNSIIEPKQDYLLIDINQWRKQIVLIAQGVLKTDYSI